MPRQDTANFKNYLLVTSRNSNVSTVACSCFQGWPSRRAGGRFAGIPKAASLVVWVFRCLPSRLSSRIAPDTPHFATTQPWRTSTRRRTLPTGSSRTHPSRRHRCHLRKPYRRRRRVRRALVLAVWSRMRRSRSNRAVGTGGRCVKALSSSFGRMLIA